jgi:disease resistance protein RPM1
LAIVSIASLLASYNSAESVEMWERVSKSIGSHMESHPSQEGMKQVITLSYDYLPHHLKACMMYLSTFPEDYVIANDRLLYKWIAEGLVAEKRGLTLFDVAEEYINDLIRRNMIQQDNMLMVRYYLLSSQKMMSHKTFGLHEKMVETCQVHDMLLEIIVSKSKEANFVSLVQQQYGGGLPHGKVRRLSVHGNDDYNEDEHSSPNKRNKKEVEQHCRRARHGGIEAMNLQHLRSLTTFQSEGLGLDKLLDRLDEFKLRRVLDLENCKALQDKHMRDVYRLYLLRFLSLRNTEISDA